MKATRITAAIAAVAASIVLVVLWIFSTRPSPVAATPSPTASPTPSAAVSASPAAILSPTALTPPTASSTPTGAPSGTITGRLGYPSEFVPPMTIFAISVKDPNVWYSTHTPFFGSFTRPTPSPTPSFAATWPPQGPGFYQLVVPAGTYYVIGYSDDTGLKKDISAAYTEATLKCTSSDPARPSPPPGQSCPYAHSPLPVTVAPGATVRYIDLTEWAFQDGTNPPRPTPR